MRKIQVGLIQQANTSDIRTNLMNLAKSIEACAARGAQLIVLQELHNSLYFCQTENTLVFDLAESIPGPSTGFYSELAAANGVVLVTSLFEKRAPGLYHNTAVVIEKDGSIADARVARGVDPYLDKEALRVIQSMPRWIPGKQNGKAVRVKYTVPVMFRLQ